MDRGRRGVVQRSEPGRERGAPTGFPGMVAILAALWLIGTVSCVRTAECNESSRCPNGEVCFQFECRDVCERDADCGESGRCVRCEDSESGENRCFGREALACLPADRVDAG